MEFLKDLAKSLRSARTVELPDGNETFCLDKWICLFHSEVILQQMTKILCEEVIKCHECRIDMLSL